MVRRARRPGRRPARDGAKSWIQSRPSAARELLGPGSQAPRGGQEGGEDRRRADQSDRLATQTGAVALRRSWRVPPPPSGCSRTLLSPTTPPRLRSPPLLPPPTASRGPTPPTPLLKTTPA